MKKFQSKFSARLSDYVKLRRRLGFKLETPEAFLSAFDIYVSKKGYLGPLTQELAIAFATENPNSSMNYREARYRTIRQFTTYLSTFEPETPILDPKAMPVTKARKRAHIFSDVELENLMGKAKRLSPQIRGTAIYAMIGLGASAGLRISEVVRLEKTDVNLREGLLTIRNTKFGKSRFVPIHSTVVRVMRSYAKARDKTFGDFNSNYFFLNSEGRRFSKNRLQVIFSELACAAGLRGPTGRGPSFHCLRHTFAVKRLVEWYQTGKDVQVMLPALATYMGHVHYTETSYYLQGTPELLNLATKRFHKLFVSKELMQ